MRAARDPLAALKDCSHLRQVDLDWLSARGVPLFALAGYRGTPAEIAASERAEMPAAVEAARGDLWFHVACAPVRFLRGGRFVFKAETRGEPEDAVLAYVVPEIDADAGLADLVAWHPRTGRLASWSGHACLLGGSALVETDAGPLPVHTSPLGWLAAWRHGIVVVHEARAARRLLDVGRPLQAEDLAHGEALDAMLARLRPRILVPDPLAEAA